MKSNDEANIINIRKKKYISNFQRMVYRLVEHLQDRSNCFYNNPKSLFSFSTVLTFVGTVGAKAEVRKTEGDLSQIKAINKILPVV